VCTCAQHCWHSEFVCRPAHVESVGPLLPLLLLLLALEPLLPLLFGVTVVFPPLLPVMLVPPPIPVPPPLPEQPVLYAVMGKTRSAAMPNALMHFTVFPPMRPLRRETGR
jgi:hypothetical protein